MNERIQGLRIEQTVAEGKAVLRLQGEVDLRTSPRLREALLDMAQMHDTVLLIDLSGVDYMDSSGVGTLVFIKREVEKQKRRLVLVGLQPRVRSVLEITHLDKFFTIADSVSEVSGP